MLVTGSLKIHYESACISRLHSRHEVQGKASLKAVILHVQRLTSDGLGIGASDCQQTQQTLRLSLSRDPSSNHAVHSEFSVNALSATRIHKAHVILLAEVLGKCSEWLASKC